MRQALCESSSLWIANTRVEFPQPSPASPAPARSTFFYFIVTLKRTRSSRWILNDLCGWQDTIEILSAQVQLNATPPPPYRKQTLHNRVQLQLQAKVSQFTA